MSFTPGLSRFNQQIVLLIGSRTIAVSLVCGLIRAGARVRWFSRDLDIAEALWLSGEPREIEIAFREPRTIDFEDAAAVIATIGEPIVFRLSEQARNAGCAVAVLGRPELSTFSVDEDPGDGPKMPNCAGRGLVPHRGTRPRGIPFTSRARGVSCPRCQALVSA